MYSQKFLNILELTMDTVESVRNMYSKHKHCAVTLILVFLIQTRNAQKSRLTDFELLIYRRHGNIDLIKISILRNFNWR